MSGCIGRTSSSSCPPCISDGDACTEEICSEDTNYKCEHRPIHPCSLPTGWSEPTYAGHCKSDLDCQPTIEPQCHSYETELFIQQKSKCDFDRNVCVTQKRQVVCCPNSCGGKYCNPEKGCYSY